MAASSKKISRAFGDESSLRMTWSFDGFVDMTSVTGISLVVYDDKEIAAATVIETLVGEVRGFDPATYFPILDGDWVGTRYYRVVLHRGTEDQPLNGIFEWTQI